MAATLQDYLDLPDKAEQVRMKVIELNAACDTLHVPIPQGLARAWADVMVLPDTIRAVGAAVTGTRHDEPEEGS